MTPILTYEDILEVLKKEKDTNLDDLVRSVGFGSDKKDFSGSIDVSNNGDVYLTLLRERHNDLEDRTLFKHVSAGLYHLKFSSDYTKIKKVEVMKEWRPTKTKIVGNTGGSKVTLYAAEGNIIRSREYNGNVPVPDTIIQTHKFGLGKDDMIIDFDVLGSSIAIVTENKETGFVDAYVKEMSGNYTTDKAIAGFEENKGEDGEEREKRIGQRGRYSPIREDKRQKIRPVSIKLMQREKDQKTYALIGAYEGDLVVLEYNTENGLIVNPEIRKEHCFLTDEQLNERESSDPLKHAVRGLMEAKDEEILFSLANKVIRISKERLLNDAIICHVENRKLGDFGLSYNLTPHTIITFDTYHM